MSKLDLIRTLAPRIREQVSPDQALTRYVPGYRAHNGFALCIAHQEDTPSMRIGPQIAHCFGCGFHGDSTELVKRLFHLDTLQAMSKLNEDFALGLPIGRKLTLRESMEIKERSAQIVKARHELKAQQMEAFERRISWERELQVLEDLRDEFRPTDPDEPFHPIFVYVTPKIEYLKYLLNSEA